VYDENVPKLSDYQGDDPYGNVEKLRKYAKDSRYRKGSHLYFQGPNGTQKTFMAKALLTESIKNGMSCRFILMNELLSKLTDIYEKDYGNLLDQYYSCDLLVIDDTFDPKKVLIFKSGYQIPYMITFLKKRMEQLQGNIVFTSTVPIARIDDSKFSPDIKDMLVRMVKDKGGELTFNERFDINNIKDSDITGNMWN